MPHHVPPFTLGKGSMGVCVCIGMKTCNIGGLTGTVRTAWQQQQALGSVTDPVSRE